jgi:hypothetical protein
MKIISGLTLNYNQSGKVKLGQDQSLDVRGDGIIDSALFGAMGISADDCVTDLRSLREFFKSPTSSSRPQGWSGPSKTETGWVASIHRDQQEGPGVNQYLILEPAQGNFWLSTEFRSRQRGLGTPAGSHVMSGNYELHSGLVDWNSLRTTIVPGR